MSVTLAFSDDALKRQRAQRAAALVRTAAIASITVSTVWLVFALGRGFHLVAAVEVAGIVAGVALLVLLRRGRPQLARHLAVVVMFALVASIIALEGNSSRQTPVVHVYLMCIAVGSFLVFFDSRPVVPAAYVGACALLFVARELGWLAFPPLGPEDPAVTIMAMHTSFIALFLIVIALVRMFVRDIATAERELARANERLEVLLEGMLPESVARRLREEGHTFADAIPSCTILVADIVGFTRLAAERTPREVVAMLDDLFSRFDDLAARFGVEKIKTLGDAYVAVAGVPEPRSDHAAAVARLALAMQAAARQRHIALRIGVNSGPVIAGVIGKKRFVYDLWGDAVNVAADLEAGAVPGGIQVTESTRRELGGEYEPAPRSEVAQGLQGEFGLEQRGELALEPRGDFLLEPRGEIEVRGGRRLAAWLLRERGHTRA